MTKLINIIGLILIINLGGCANVSTVKSSKNIFDGKSVSLVPTGSVKIEGMSDTLGGAFGVLGALIEAAVTEKSRNESANQASERVGTDVAYRLVGETIEKDLYRFGGARDYKITQRTLSDQDFTKWFNPETRTDLSATSGMIGDLAIDYGFQHLAITSYLAGTYAEGVIGIRVIETRTGKVIARSRTFGAGAFGGEKITTDKADPKYNEEVALAFSRLITRLTREAITKVVD